MTDDRNGQPGNGSTIQTEKTPLMIGLGIVIRGEILDESGDKDSRMLILGRVEGNITTKGIVQITKGAEVVAGSVIQAGKVVVSGRLVGKDVIVKTDVLVLQSTGYVDVDTVILPPGGLEQMRGGVLIARLDMSGVAATPATVPASVPVATLFSSPVAPTAGSVTSLHAVPVFSPSPRASAFHNVELPNDDDTDDNADTDAAKSKVG